MNEDERPSKDFYFSTVDYCVFAAMLILSATSGTYFGYIRKHKPPIKDLLSRTESSDNKKTQKDFGSSSMNEYLLGSRKLKPFPVSMSLIASYISGVTILGTPAEIYNYGSQYCTIVLPIMLMGIVVSTVYLPVFSSLKVNSSYEYLELRFSSSVRTVASLMFVIDEILFLPIIIYVPALAFNQVTGANLYLIGGIVCVVCIFYTIIGGIKAVVHTDAWQVMVMFLSVLVVTIIGTSLLGGPGEVFDRAFTGGRLNFFNMSPSMYERHTFWGVLIGGFSYWTSFNSVNQTMVQRYMSLPNLKNAKQSIAMFTVGISMFVSICCYAGILVYAEFYNCDPTMSGLIKMNEDERPSKDFYFSTVDYCVFAAMLILSATSGTYFGYIRKHKPPIKDLLSRTESSDNKKTQKDFGSSSMNEYLLGSRKLKPFPVSMSLIASYISGVTILGTPAEIYNYGSQYCTIVLPIMLMGIVVSTVYLPVFSSLKVNSSYEYLELRFSSSVRTVASLMFVIDEILFLPIIIYVPALAFNQVTGANLYLIGGIVCVVCIFYTIIGGIKAVVHTDAWQVMVMFLSVLVVTIIGTSLLGGPGEVFDRAFTGGRLNFFNMSPSMYERHTFWGVLIGGFSYWTSFNSVNQTMVQRYMSLPNLKNAKQSIAMFTVGISMFVSICCYAGILVYAEFYNCDPTMSGLIKADDQLFPVYVMKTVGNLRGLPGLFIAGVFGAALSSLSVVLNSTAAVLLEDIFKGCFNGKPTEKVAGFIVKGSILALGALAMLLLFVVEKLGGILGVATSLSAIAAGTTFGIFTLGMLVPWSNTNGALWGSVAGALMSGWVSFGSQAQVAAGYLIPQKLNSSIAACEAFNLTLSNPMPHDESDVFPLYRLSFHWINPIGVLSVLVVGTIVSFVTGARDLKVIDPELISPVIHRFLPQECWNNFGNKSTREHGTGLVYLRSQRSDTLRTSTLAEAES